MMDQKVLKIFDKTSFSEKDGGGDGTLHKNKGE
jgi:hypothetical protein